MKRKKKSPHKFIGVSIPACHATILRKADRRITDETSEVEAIFYCVFINSFVISLIIHAKSPLKL